MFAQIEEEKEEGDKVSVVSHLMDDQSDFNSPK